MGPLFFFLISGRIGLLLLPSDFEIIKLMLFISPGLRSNRVSRYESTFFVILVAIGLVLRMYICSRMPETRTLR